MSKKGNIPASVFERGTRGVESVQSKHPQPVFCLSSADCVDGYIRCVVGGGGVHNGSQLQHDQNSRQSECATSYCYDRNVFSGVRVFFGVISSVVFVQMG